MRKRFSVIAMVVIAMMLVVPAVLAATTVVVTPDDLSNDPGYWHEANQRVDGLREITASQPDSHGGTGSLEQTLTGSDDKTDLRIFQKFGLLGYMDAFSFEWFRDQSSTAPGHLTPAISVLVFDPDAGVSGSSYLFKWEGTYNGYPTTGPSVVTDEWVYEDLLEGNFWRIPQTLDDVWVGFAHCNNVPTFECFVFDRGLDDWGLSSDSVVIGIEVGVGSGWAGTYRSFVDHVVIGFTGDSMTYDFEPFVAASDPVNANDCKDGGWQDYGFKNQGLCIQFVNTGKDSR